MKISLKLKLIISYVMLSLFLVFSLLGFLNIFLEKQFQEYTMERQEQKNLGYVNAVSDRYVGGAPSSEVLLSLGQSALDEGIILMVYDNEYNKVFCMSCLDSVSCEDMLISMEHTMENHYPGFDGHYTEKTYPLIVNDQIYGSVVLGFYGPFYYEAIDIAFIELINNIFVIIAIVFLLIAILLGYIMSSRISKPIKSITLKTNNIAKGQYTDKINISTNTKEIDSLISSVNNLATSLETQKHLKKRMASDYSHEFRTPLATIQSNLEGIIDGIFEPSNDRLESLRQEILRLSRMVSQIDKIAEIEVEKPILNIENFDLGAMLHHVALAFENESKSKNINIKLKIEPCFVNADKDKMNQVVVNLISNAIKYTNHGEILISLSSTSKEHIITIKDTGVGIGDKDLPYIFDYLYRVDTSRTRDTGGTGIGLSVVKSIIKAHNGEITVNSKLGQGSEFIIKLKK